MSVRVEVVGGSAGPRTGYCERRWELWNVWRAETEKARRKELNVMHAARDALERHAFYCAQCRKYLEALAEAGSVWDG